MPNPLTPESGRIESHLKALVRERNPYTSPNHLDAAADHIRAHLESLDLSVREETVPFDGLHSRNVLGLQPGTEPEAAPFVLAAHFDTVEGSPGADDNASAVAALLEIARCLRPVRLKHSLLYAGFTLEEYGFVGSRFFLDQANRRKETFLGMISLEMVGFCNRTPGSQTYPPYVDASQFPDTGDFIAVVGNEPSARLTQSLAKEMHRATPALGVEMLVVPGRGDQFPEVNLSDHSPFWDDGIPAAMVTDTAFLRNPHYHQSTDTMETLDIDFIRETCRGLAGFLENFLG